MFGLFLILHVKFLMKNEYKRSNILISRLILHLIRIINLEKVNLFNTYCRLLDGCKIDFFTAPNQLFYYYNT